jgi:hypothetical protein
MELLEYHQSFEKLNTKERQKNFAKKHIYVTRYITEWNFDTQKISTTVSGDQLNNQRRSWYLE